MADNKESAPIWAKTLEGVMPRGRGALLLLGRLGAQDQCTDRHGCARSAACIPMWFI